MSDPQSSTHAKSQRKMLARRICLSLSTLIAIFAIFTIYANIRVEHAAHGLIYDNVDSVPYNRVTLIPGTNPVNRKGRPNTYFTSRIHKAADLYRAGKTDHIIVSGDNHTTTYDEPTAMRDSLVALGVPAEAITLDFAGFRTLDSVVRARRVFGCDSLTIISQDDHAARALYLASANGIKAVGVSARARSGQMVRLRLRLREWLARDKMMLDLLIGRKPRFLGEPIALDIRPRQKSYSTYSPIAMTIDHLQDLRPPVDSITVTLTNGSDSEITFGERYQLETDRDGRWVPVEINPSLLRIIRSDNPDPVAHDIDFVIHDIGYGITPRSAGKHTCSTRLYSESIVPGRYRLMKTVRLNRPGSDTRRTDTLFVEFDVR